MTEFFRLAIEERIGTLIINRPDRRNALSAEMMRALGRMCRTIEDNDDIRLVILSGEEKAFCAGGDIDAWSALSPRAFALDWVRNGHRIFDRLARLRQPVIAVLNGHALGGGLELATCADYRIAESHITIGQPEARLGIIPGWSGTQRAVRRFGSQNVRRMALFGETFNARQALHAGIIDEVAETGAGMDAARARAQALLNRGMEATELTKMLINACEGEETERVLETLAGRIAAGSDELSEGLAAFRQRRKPDFK